MRLGFSSGKISMILVMLLLFDLIQQTHKLNEWSDIMKPNYLKNYKTRIERRFTKLLLAIEIKEKIPTGMMMIQTNRYKLLP